MNKDQLFESTEITSTTIPLNSPYANFNDFDVVARISGSTSSRLIDINVAPTAYFVSELRSKYSMLEADIERLQHLTHWQHKVIDYNSSYIALLLEQIDEDEFEKVANEYAESAQYPEISDLALEIERLQSLTSFPLSIMDYSNMFGVGEDDVMSALEKIVASHSNLEQKGREQLE